MILLLSLAPPCKIQEGCHHTNNDMAVMGAWNTMHKLAGCRRRKKQGLNRVL